MGTRQHLKETIPYSRITWSEMAKQNIQHRAPVAQLVEHRAVMREVVSSTPARPTLGVLK